MKTYTVHIESKEYYTIEVEAQDETDAEDKAWKLFPCKSADGGENNVTAVICEGERDASN